MVPDTAADETVLDMQSISVPVVPVRHRHSFAQIIIRWNCLLWHQEPAPPNPEISCTQRLVRLIKLYKNAECRL